MATVSNLKLDAKGNIADIAVVETSSGLLIYVLPIETFPGHINNLYFVDHTDHKLLIDSGSRQAHDQLERAFERLRAEFGVETTLETLDEMFLTHGHGDHFGNAHAFREMGVPIAGHKEAARTLRSLEHRLPLYRRHLGLRTRRAGFDERLVRSVVEAPFFEFPSMEIDRVVGDGDTLGPGWRLTHVPGHSPGQLVLEVDDVLFTADHVLARITPAQGPTTQQPNIGLDRYVESLRKILPISQGKLGLGGHEGPIEDLPKRIAETIEHHNDRLRRIHAYCQGGERTGAEICRHLFGDFEAQGLILALSETLSHIEYLYIDGFVDVTNSENPGDVFDDVLVYRAREGSRTEDIAV